MGWDPHRASGSTFFLSVPPHGLTLPVGYPSSLHSLPRWALACWGNRPRGRGVCGVLFLLLLSLRLLRRLRLRWAECPEPTSAQLVWSNWGYSSAVTTVTDHQNG